MKGTKALKAELDRVQARMLVLMAKKRDAHESVALAALTGAQIALLWVMAGRGRPPPSELDP